LSSIFLSLFFGGLLSPSPYLFGVLRHCEQIFNDKFDSIKYCVGVKQHLMDAMCQSVAEPCTNSIMPCPITLKLVVDLYVRMRLYYKLKFINRTMKQEAKRKNKKAAKIMHA